VGGNKWSSNPPDQSKKNKKRVAWQKKAGKFFEFSSSLARQCVHQGITDRDSASVANLVATQVKLLQTGAFAANHTEMTSRY
jgi:hypothetical protein